METAAHADINTLLEREVESLASKGLSITRTAYEKLEYIIGEYTSIISSLGLPEQEMALYMLTSKEEAMESRPVVRDFYIAHEQVVSPSYCKIENPITSCRDIRDNLGMRIVGWAHSHASHRPFLSAIDAKTFDCFLQDYPLFAKLDVEEDGEYEATYTYSLIVNSRKERPYTSVNVSLPQYQGGRDSFAVDGDTPVLKRNVRIEDIPLNIIEDGHYEPDDEEKARIREELCSRIILSNGSRLEKYAEMAAPMDEEEPEEERALTLEERVSMLEQENTRLRGIVAHMESRIDRLENLYKAAQLT
jgi:proteasome lid subunit RPN8/RPN11